jgi:hypothetical protein
MDDELIHLESELAALRPVGPSRDLLDRIGSQLESSRRPIVVWGWLATAMAAAAAIAVILLPAKTTVSEPIFKPVAARDVLYGARDEGYVQLGDGTPAHRLREYHLDTITWRNPASNASLSWSIPRDEIRVIPASFQ